MMSPNTASKLRESKRNVLKDFVHVAGPLGITHLMMLSATQNAAYLRIAKSPRGPTITLRIHAYSLVRDVLASQQRPRAPQSMWLTAPLVVLNNFNSAEASKEDGENLKLATVMFQNLFPSINASTTKLSSCQRVVLLDYEASTKKIQFRHYSVAIKPSGVSKNLKLLLGRKDLPDMGRLTDVSEFLTKSGYGSESEAEDADASRINIETSEGKAGSKSTTESKQSRIRLYEVGPRMELEIIKVEEGLCGGRVLFHRYVKKSKAEIAAQQNKIESAALEKEKRRKQQEENVRRKQAEKRRREGVDSSVAPNAEKEKSKTGKKRKRTKQWWEEDPPRQNDDGDDGDDDVEWYEREVGELPDDVHALQGNGTKRERQPARGRSVVKKPSKSKSNRKPGN